MAATDKKTTTQILNRIKSWANQEFIRNTANNLVNYYLKSETYTKAEVQQLLNAIKQFTYQAVQSLPTASADTMNIIYLVPTEDPKTKNVKDEFITIDNGAGATTRYTWEQIGSTQIDLSGYYTSAQTDAAITAALNSALANYVAVNESQQFTELQKAQARNNIGAYSKPDNGIPVSDINLTNLPEIGIGYGICTTDTYEASKVVAIPNFLLIQEATINVLFTTPINTENATLNVSLTGAKPIRILGQALPAGVIKAQTYATLAYDGVAWNIVNIFCPDASFDPAALVVDMGLPSGVKWAARDIDLTKPGGFCDTPFTYEKTFFSWGNIDGHNPISTSAFDYNWGSVNAQEPYYEGQPYGSTPGNTLTGNIAVGEDFDAARANLGAPWRMPTRNEFVELFSNIIYINADGTEVDTTKADKRVTVNGIMGLYIQSTINGARLFFSCSGFGNGSSWNNRGSYGIYWSSTFNSSRNARNLNFYSGGVNPQYNLSRCNGFSVRAVQ